MLSRHSQHGMTLMEVLVALALFSLVSLMGWQAMGAMEKQGQRLELRQNQLGDLASVVMLFESDVVKAQPFVAHPSRLIDVQDNSGRIEMDLPAGIDRVGLPTNYVRWVIDGDVIRRYPARENAARFVQWRNVARGIRLIGIQENQRIEWPKVQANRPVQGLEFRFLLADGSEVWRVIAIAGAAS